jgi:hypothetical protein
LKAGFQFDPGNPLHRESGNASRYTLYRLPYSPIIVGEGTLRPEILDERMVFCYTTHPDYLGFASLVEHFVRQNSHLLA